MLKRILDFRTKTINISGNDNYTEFSVLIPILVNKNNYELLYEIRSENLKNQPNEICFPGGKIEKDESKEDAAKRETVEELLLDYDDVDIIGPSDIIVTPFNIIVYPYVGIIKNYNYTYNEDEVKEVFTVPLSFFLYNEPKFHYIDVKLIPENDFPYDLIQNGKDYRWGKGKYPVYFYIYRDKIIWGITARITYDFIKHIK